MLLILFPVSYIQVIFLSQPPNMWGTTRPDSPVCGAPPGLAQKSHFNLSHKISQNRNNTLPSHKAGTQLHPQKVQSSRHGSRSY